VNTASSEILKDIFVKQYEQKTSLLGLCRCEKMSNLFRYARAEQIHLLCRAQKISNFIEFLDEVIIKSYTFEHGITHRGRTASGTDRFQWKRVCFRGAEAKSVSNHEAIFVVFFCWRLHPPPQRYVNGARAESKVNWHGPNTSSPWTIYYSFLHYSFLHNRKMLSLL
jgi:hypothetical protein